MDAEVTESAEPTLPAKPDRTLLAILIVVALLVVVALVVVLVRSVPQEPLDKSTPEGVVQRYAQAVIDGDDDAAAQYLAAPLKDCEYYERGPIDMRLTFKATNKSDSSATVRVTISTSYGSDPFSSSEYSYEDRFVLVRSGESWLIEQTPYDFISCGAVK